MKSRATSQFFKEFEKLPRQIQQRAKRAYRIFKLEPYYPSLHFKQVHNTKPIYSVRISVSYRALGVLQEDTIIWFWIGSHADYDKLIDRL